VKIEKYKKILLLSFINALLAPMLLYASVPVNLIGSDLLPRSEIFITPSQKDISMGSVFNVPIYLNTLGYNVNAINLKINFDATKLKVVNPSVGKSILGIWVEPFNFNNTKGTASLMGVVPNGITTKAGLIATLTFKAIETGKAKISITDYSSANLNDGYGSNVFLILKEANYNILPKTLDNASVSSPSVIQKMADSKVIENKPQKNNYQIVRQWVFDWSSYYILIIIIGLLILWILFHYLFGHYLKKRK